MFVFCCVINMRSFDRLACIYYRASGADTETDNNGNPNYRCSDSNDLTKSCVCVCVSSHFVFSAGRQVLHHDHSGQSFFRPMLETNAERRKLGKVDRNQYRA